jgi:S-adenosylmethionine synthetase
MFSYSDYRMKVLITGATGLLGRSMMRAFEGCEVLGLGFTRADPAQHIVKCDLRDAAAFQKIVEDFKPFVIVHCAAERRPDVCAEKPELARELNVEYVVAIRRKRGEGRGGRRGEGEGEGEREGEGEEK